MATLTDPSTGRPLPQDAIQRILHITSSQVHVYNIPPLASTKGYTAATWTEDPKRQIFTCRIRIIETAIPHPDGTSPDKVKVDLVLEDPSTGQLFAAVPYTSKAAVEPCIDSSRFFAVRVQDPSGRKAMVGIGFEERSEAFDFGVSLQEAQKALGLLEGVTPGSSSSAKQQSAKDEEKRDYSLKEGETITVNLSGTKFGRRQQKPSSPSTEQSSSAPLSSFALPPPPGPGGSSNSSSGSSFGLPPPPSAADVKSRRRLSAKDLGFDDGKFGEFA